MTDPHDPAWFRQVLGQYPTGVSVVCGIGTDGLPTGLVVGSFTSVSLTPPVVAFFPDKGSSSWPKIRPGKRFCVNILAHDQEHLCRQFAAKGADKFKDVAWRPAGTGSPIIEHVVAWIDCEVAGVHDAGDHDIVLGRVMALDVERPADPLLFFRGGYGRFAPLSLAVGDSDLRRELLLVDQARAEMEAIGNDLEAQCIAWALVGDELVLLASAGGSHRRGIPSSVVGVRLPAAPPVGATWMAYAPAARLEAWLARAPAEDRDGLRLRVQELRDRGYTVALRGPELAELEAVLERGTAAQSETLLRALPVDPPGFDPAQARDVATLSVPVLGAHGEVELLLGLHGFRRLQDAADLERHVARLQDGAQAIRERWATTC